MGFSLGKAIGGAGLGGIVAGGAGALTGGGLGASGILGGLFGKKGPQSLYTGPVLPDWLSQGGQDFFSRAQSLSKQPFQQFNPSANPNWTPEQQQAVSMMKDNVNRWAGASTGATNLLNDTISGKYLDIGTNPAWAANAGRITDSYLNTVRPQTDAQFARANAFGGGNSAYDQIVGLNNRSLADSLGKLAGDLYTTERGNQMNALGMFPTVFSATQAPAQSLFNIGQTSYDTQLADYNRATQDPFMRLNFLGDAFGAIAPSYTGQVSPNPNQRSGFADLLGGGLAGGGLGAKLGGKDNAGFGALLGGGAGALLGLLS